MRKKQMQPEPDVDARHERTEESNDKLRRNQLVREKAMPHKNVLPDKNAPGLTEKEDEDEMEDLYREEENRGKVEAE